MATEQLWLGTIQCKWDALLGHSQANRRLMQNFPGKGKALIFDSVEDQETAEDIQAARQKAARLVQRWDKRALSASIALVVSCAGVYPFLAERPLHRYWESCGKYLLLLSMALLPPFVLCVGIALNARAYRRSLNKLE